MRALICGALFGFFTYATYDLTNPATVSGKKVRPEARHGKPHLPFEPAEAADGCCSCILPKA